jgi:hypothetical protein
MKRVILLVLVVVSVMFTGCATSTSITPLPTPSLPEATKTVEPSAIADVETKLMNNTWISPAKVEIGNYYPGARAEWTIRVHNSNEETTQIEKKMVGIFENETLVDIYLKYPLADNDITKVTVTSDNNKDSLVVNGYLSLNKVLTISGFEPSESRIISIVYKAWTEFKISYRIPDNTMNGYAKAPPNAQDWVIIADSTTVFRPKETKEILVVLQIPEGTVVLDKQWEFWTSVSEGGQGTVQTEMCTRWLVKMRS